MILSSPEEVKVSFWEIGDTTIAYSYFDGKIQLLIDGCNSLCINPPVNFILIYNGLDVQFTDKKKSYQKTYANIEAVCTGCINYINDKAKILK